MILEIQCSQVIDCKLIGHCLILLLMHYWMPLKYGNDQVLLSRLVIELARLLMLLLQLHRLTLLINPLY